VEWQRERKDPKKASAGRDPLWKSRGKQAQTQRLGGRPGGRIQEREKVEEGGVVGEVQLLKRVWGKSIIVVVLVLSDRWVFEFRRKKNREIREKIQRWKKKKEGGIGP